MDMKVYKSIACSILVGSFLASAALAGNTTKEEEKGASLEQKAQQEETTAKTEASEGHRFKAGRAGKKAGKDAAKASKEFKKAGVAPATTMPAQ